MNKFMLFGVLIFVLIMITFVVNQYAPIIEGLEMANGIDTQVIYQPAGYNVSNVWSMGVTFRKMLLFEISGEVLPSIFVLGVVYPILGILIYMVIDVVKDLIPFT